MRPVPSDEHLWFNPHAVTTLAAELTPVLAPTPPVRRAGPLRRILAITSNLQQASSRLRVAALVDPLRERGFDLEVRACPRTWSARRELLCSAGAYHAVILQRKL